MNRFKKKINAFRELDGKGKRRRVGDMFVNNSLYIFMILFIIYIQLQTPTFLSLPSIVNVLTLSAANIPIALGVAGTIVLTGTDLSAGRIVGLTAVIAASLAQPLAAATKMFPGLQPLPLPVLLLITMVVGGIVGFINGFSVSKFDMHPFIVTLATQLIVYGFLLMYLNFGTGNGQAISGLGDYYKDFINGSTFRIAGYPIPNLVLYSLVIIAVVWVIWNKTKFGKNMFAVGSNKEAAEVSGVNVVLTIIGVFVLAGMLYGYTGFVEAARIGSNSASTGLNYESDAFAAAVIGGVSFTGGVGTVGGVIVGVVLLRLIFVGLTSLGVDPNLQYIIKGLIILVAVAIDMRKYMKKK